MNDPGALVYHPGIHKKPISQGVGRAISASKNCSPAIGLQCIFCRLHYGADTQVFYFPNRLRPLELFFLSLDRAGNQSLDKELLAKEEYQEHRYNAQAARCHGQVIFGALFVNKLVHSYR